VQPPPGVVTVKSVLVPSIGHSNVAFEAGAAIARLFDAHMACLRIHPDPVDVAVKASGTALTAEIGGSLVVSDLWKILEDEDRQRSQTVRARFDAVAASLPKGRASWHERTGDEVNEVATFGRWHDLVVVDGQVDGGLPPPMVGNILHACGKPLLLAGKPRPTLGQSVIIAWKNAPEAARALTAAMPFLKRARRILVASVTENGHPSRANVEGAEGVVGLLRHHGLAAEAKCVTAGERPPAIVISSMAGEWGADLMVMGAYGHSRMRETVFGGFTRHVLSGVTVPALMVH